MLNPLRVITLFEQIPDQVRVISKSAIYQILLTTCEGYTGRVLPLGLQNMDQSNPGRYRLCFFFLVGYNQLSYIVYMFILQLRFTFTCKVFELELFDCYFSLSWLKLMKLADLKNVYQKKN